MDVKLLMKLQRIEDKNVVVPGNELDRKILQGLSAHVKPDYAGYWEVKSNDYDPLDVEEKRGRIYVSWENTDGTRHLDPFPICINEAGHLQVCKMSMPFKQV